MSALGSGAKPRVFMAAARRNPRRAPAFRVLCRLRRHTSMPTRQELEAIAKKPGEESVRLHALYRGKIQVALKCPVGDIADFAYWYTPGVAAPCRASQP